MALCVFNFALLEYGEDVFTYSMYVCMCMYLLGISTSDGALYESLKLLCSLLVTLVGKGLYGTATSSNSSTNVVFINQGMFVPHSESHWCLFCLL